MDRVVAKRPLTLLAAGLLCACGEEGPADASSVEDAELFALRTRMQPWIDWLDSDGYAQQVPFAQHVERAQRLTQHRALSPTQFDLLQLLHEEIGLSRSQVLAWFLQGNGPRESADNLRRFVTARAREEFLRERFPTQTPELAEEAEQAETPGNDDLWHAKEEAVVRAALPEANRAYNIYFGYLHAHSELSDGEQSPEYAYRYAREEGQLDYFALTDHGERLNLWPWERKWQRLIAAADAAYEPGRFVSLWGFEWSHALLGHISVINTEDFTNALRRWTLGSLYRWIRRRPEAFARFNHPGRHDGLKREFGHFKRSDSVLEQMVGVEQFNKDLAFDEYYYQGSWSSAYGYIDEGNRKGWRLGALGGQDNHQTDWGTRNEFRTAVLAEALVREEIVDAYRNRRFYVTEDRDLYLDFRCQGFPMGSILQDVERVFEVTACDGSGDKLAEVRLYRNGDFLAALEPARTAGEAAVKVPKGWLVSPQACVRLSFSDEGASNDDYYYVIATQADDNDENGRNDEAISSPIWIQEPQ